MLYAYPEEATAENWLHECLVDMLTTVHAAISANEAVPAWPGVIPAAHRNALARRRGLRDRLVTYSDACAALPKGEREELLRALQEQNQIAHLLSCQSNCQMVSGMPEAIRLAIKSLFEFAFETLTWLGVRDRLYQAIYGKIPDAMCPFCGSEYFDAPGAPREALDHYLPQSKYPFAAANLRNLVPMGNKCNSRYKLAQDILHWDDGTRRRSFDPYGTVTVRLSLARSAPFAGTNGKVPAWTIDFAPDSEEAATWDSVFQIRERYKRDLLDACFDSWLDQFASWCRSTDVVVDEDKQVIDALNRYSQSLRDNELQNRNFLRAEVFDLFRAHCQAGDERSINLIRGFARLKPRPPATTTTSSSLATKESH